MIFRLMTPKEIEYWYKALLPDCFVPDEIKPWADFERLLSEDRYEIWGVFSDDPKKPLPFGFATIWKRPGIPLVLLDYLGVMSSGRNGGTGAWMLQQLKTQGRPLVCEAELPIDGSPEEENSLRRRRIAFYERCGLHPAYEMCTCGFRMQALLMNDTACDLNDLMRWHKLLYDEKRTDVKVPIGPNEIPQPAYWMQ